MFLSVSLCENYVCVSLFFNVFVSLFIYLLGLLLFDSFFFGPLLK